MPVKTKNKIVGDSTTQRYLPFSQIRENIIIMKDNSGRIVLKCSTINFLLKSQEEQNAIIISFQRFLNSLDFPIQILIRSKKLDLDGYLERLGEISKKQKNILLKEQTENYIEYLKRLVEIAQIMKKEFYIIIPFDLEEGKSVRDNSLLGLFSNFWKSINNSNSVTKIRMQIRNFNDIKKGLLNKINVIKTSLENIGIKANELEKEELIKFLADYYNPSLDNHTSFSSSINSYNVTKN